MAKMYVGVSGKARLVKNFYIGRSGVARKVVRAWVGVNGVARLFYESSWWTAGGISTANCLAAYQFKGASSETVARTDLTGHGYTLTKYNSPTWATGTGFTLPTNAYLQNSSLNGQNIKSIVIRFAGMPTTTGTTYALSLPGGSGNNRFLYVRLRDLGYFNGANIYNADTNYPVLVYAWNQYETSGTTPRFRFRYYQGSTKLGATGVLGFSGTALYSNGVAQTTTAELTNTESTGTPISGTNRFTIGQGAGYSVIAAAFYSVDLTAAQHKAVADAMLAL